MSDNTVDELKERIQELEDELQQLKEKRKQEYSDPAAVDEEIEEVHDQIRDEADQSGMSRRKFMKAIAGGGAALGAAAMMPSAAALDIESNNPLSYNNNFSVDTQGNLNLQGKDITNAGSIGTETVSTEEVTTGVVKTVDEDVTADVLQSEIDDLSSNPASGGTIILTRALTFSAGNSITIKEGVKIIAGGRMKKDVAYNNHGAVIEGDVSGGPVVTLNKHANLEGIGVRNINADGDAIEQHEYTTVQNCYIYADRYGINIVQQETGGAEAEVLGNKINSDAPGTVGIRNTGSVSDNEIHGNIIRGFLTGIQALNSGNITDNHPYPNTFGMNVGIHVNNEHRVRNNYVDNAANVGILIQNRDDVSVTDNLITGQDGADGIRFEPATDGDLQRVEVTGNRIFPKDYANDTLSNGITHDGSLSGFFDTTIKRNRFRSVANEGLKTRATGTATRDGDGSNTVWDIPDALAFGMGDASNMLVKVIPISDDAFNSGPVTARAADTRGDGDINDIQFVFASAPPSGNGNVEVRWEAEADRGNI